MLLKKKFFILVTINLIIIISVLLYIFKSYNSCVTSDIKEYLSTTYKIEKQLIRSFPIYSDFRTGKIEKELRTYLFKDHYKVAKSIGVGPLKDNSMIKKFYKEKKLVSIDGKENNYYFYGVKKEYRYLTPKTDKGLKLVVSKFQEKLKEKKIPVNIKLALSSAIRPESYQASLRKKNGNAVLKSTHSYGVSFDIFWDDYYLVLPEAGDTALAKKIIGRTRKRMGFVLGDSLRRQLRSILTASLLELQREGYIYAILERKQRCFHVTVLDKVIE